MRRKLILASALALVIPLSSHAKEASPDGASPVIHAALYLQHESIHEASLPAIFKNTLESLKHSMPSMSLKEMETGAWEVSCKKRAVSVSAADAEQVATAFKKIKPIIEACMAPAERLKMNRDKVGYDALILERMIARYEIGRSFLRREELAEITHPQEASIGVMVRKDGASLTVAHIAPNSPAGKAGMVPGDRIVKINDAPADNYSAHDAALKLRGMPQSGVLLLIHKKDDPKPQLIPLSREIAPPQSVRYALLNGEVGYVWISHFDESTPKELNQAMNDLATKHPKALILDLRDNAGGLLEIAEQVAGRFLSKGKLIAKITGKTLNKDIIADSGDKIKIKKIGVLVNAQTANGAEIVVSSLKDWKRAVVIGQKTAGLSRIQTLLNVAPAGWLKVTIATAYSPLGNKIDGVGITPDIDLETTRWSMDIETDPAIQAALSLYEHGKKKSY